MKHVASVLAVALLLFTSLAQAQQNPIAIRMAAFIDAYNAGEFETLAGIYTEGGVLLPPQASAIVGREALAAYYANAKQNGVASLAYSIIDIRQTGPASVVEIGEARATAANGAVFISRSMHSWVLIDGGWYLDRDMFHTMGQAE